LIWIREKQTKEEEEANKSRKTAREKKRNIGKERQPLNQEKKKKDGRYRTNHLK